MPNTVRQIAALLTFCLLVTYGCTTSRIQSHASLPRSAYFEIDPLNLEALHTLARTQEARMRVCPTATGCDHDAYTRGLIALFENRADAINIFQQLRTTMPDSRYTAESTRWLYLLQERFTPSSHNSALQAQLRDAVLHHLLDGKDLTLSRRPQD